MPGSSFSLLALAGSAVVLGTMGVQVSSATPSQQQFPGIFNGTNINPDCEASSMPSFIMSYKMFVPRAKPMHVWKKIGNPYDLTWTDLTTFPDIDERVRTVMLEAVSDPQSIVASQSHLFPDTSLSGTASPYDAPDNYGYYVTSSRSRDFYNSLELLQVSVGACSPSLLTNTNDLLANNPEYRQDDDPDAWTITQVDFNVTACLTMSTFGSGRNAIAFFGEAIQRGITNLYPDATSTCLEALAAGAATTPTDEPSTDEPSTDEPSTDEPSTDEPSTDEPSTDEPSTDEPSTDEPSTDEPSIDEPSTDEPSTDEPSTDEPSTDEPSTDEPSTDEPSTDEP
ncbi:hypothetical protein CXG81DRAFT_17404, partial [Caulochytrium protostelioides]